MRVLLDLLSEADYGHSLDCGWRVYNDQECAIGFSPIVTATFKSFHSEDFNDYAVLFDGSNQ